MVSSLSSEPSETSTSDAGIHTLYALLDDDTVEGAAGIDLGRWRLVDFLRGLTSSTGGASSTTSSGSSSVMLREARGPLGDVVGLRVSLVALVRLSPVGEPVLASRTASLRLRGVRSGSSGVSLATRPSSTAGGANALAWGYSGVGGVMGDTVRDSWLF